MKSHLRKLFFIIFGGCLLFLQISFSFATFRSYDIYRPGAKSTGMGATGTAAPSSLSDFSLNSAYLAEMLDPAFIMGLDAKARIERLLTEVSFKPQYLPILGFATPIYDNAGIGFFMDTIFQRRLPKNIENFIFYNLETAFAYTVHQNLSIGVTAGLGLGLQANHYLGKGFTYSISLLFRNAFLSAGLLFRPGSRISYSPFASGKDVEERMPDFWKVEISKKIHKFKKIKNIEFAFGFEYLNWDQAEFVEDGYSQIPQFQNNWLGYLNPHIGISLELKKWQGLIFRTGFFTEDYYDVNGVNSRQLLWSFGLGGVAYRSFWADNLKIDFSYISSFLMSFVYDKNNQIDRFQVSFEFSFPEKNEFCYFQPVCYEDKYAKKNLDNLEQSKKKYHRPLNRACIIK